MWDVPTKYNPNELWYVEMILQDRKGERMHAVLSRSLLKRWGKVLKEFHLFSMRWFVVVEDKLKSKTTETDMVLTFSNKTQVTPLANPSFPLEALRMKPIGDLLQAEKIDDAEMFDKFTFSGFLHVVALVVGSEDPREMLTKQGKELKRLQIIVEDIEATCWNGRTSIQSNLAVSEVYINPELSEVVAFRESLVNGGARTLSRISHVSSRTAVSAAGELSQPNVQVMKIENVLKCTEPWIAASIMGVNNGMHDWCYIACSNCGKKVECAPMGRYECTNEKCGHSGTKPLSKYKVEVMVYDGTTCLNLLMWDTQVIQLEELGYPPTLDNLIERNALFKINVKQSNTDKDDRVYTVSNICEDDKLVHQHLPEDFTSQANGAVTEMGGSNFVEDPEAVANLQVESHDHLHVAIGDDSVSTRTPGKRNVAD
ncbi:hypothetical protein PIB30_066102 [Stylosanthes scabra]|uniref:Replication protein A 70 kDa DNA-binding subunit B/D first OB fold domain-containing protein n=1 Tax=Stylosanthes scabra TaxID=79078 RepID=A0ABU6SMW7_9FABA|nr:hypothetical protein [Stylosanthes scabra]